jgi:hypothetical protein
MNAQGITNCTTMQRDAEGGKANTNRTFDSYWKNLDAGSMSVRDHDVRIRKDRAATGLNYLIRGEK